MLETLRQCGVDTVEHHWTQAEAEELFKLASNLGVTPAAVVLGQYLRLIYLYIGTEKPLVECMVSIRPFLPESIRDDLIGPLTVGVPLLFEEPEDDVARSALLAADKITSVFRALPCVYLDAGPAPFGFSYREANLSLPRLWPDVRGVLQTVSPLWNQVKLSFVRNKNGAMARMNFRTGVMDFEAANLIVSSLVPSTGNPSEND